MSKLSTRGLLFSAVALCLTVHSTAHAQGMFDFVKTKTEASEVRLVYDLASFTGSPGDLKNAVREALTYQGDNAFVKDNLLNGDVPRFPSELTVKNLAPGLPVDLTIPSCAGSTFSVSSSDSSMSKYGDNSSYMACGFPYVGGYRVSFYAKYKSTSGGVMGLLSGKTIGTAVTKALGFGSDPQTFVLSSVAKMEELFAANGWAFSLVQMAPEIAGKTVVPDPLKVQQMADAKRGADRGKRMAARAELNKLGIDASDRAKLQKAIQSSDEDVVALFVEAGAIDVRAKDSDGKTLAEYATKPVIRDLLISEK